MNNLDDSSDIKPTAMLRQIDVLSNDISGLEDSASDFKENGDFWDNKLQRQG